MNRFLLFITLHVIVIVFHVDREGILNREQIWRGIGFYPICLSCHSHDSLINAIRIGHNQTKQK